MVMGGHAAPPVSRGPSSPAFFAFLLAHVALILSHAVVSSAGPTDSSSASLLKFKSSLKNTGALKNWDSSTNPCTGKWFGILCWDDGQVWGVQLENLKLSGEIDVESLVPLTMLRSVSIMKNEFHGQMPDWKKLSALKSLFISDNHFEGDVPADTFLGMSYLKKVHMANNDFTGAIPSSLSTPRLLELRIENNQFTGSIPELRDGITSFNVSNNRLEGPIPPSVAKVDVSAFAGNKALCGAPLVNECGTDQAIPQSQSPNSDSNTTPQTGTGAAKKKSKSSIAMIVGMVIGILVATSLVIVLLLVYLRSRKKRKTVGFVEQTPYFRKSRSPQSSFDEVEAPPVVAAGVTKKAEGGKLSFVSEDTEKFELQDLLRASAEVLGSGSFGSSYKAVLMDGKAVVVKRYKKMNNIEREDFHEHMRRLGRLHHSNVLPIVAYYYRKEEKLLVFDHVHNGSLAGRLHGKHSEEKPFLSWPQRLKIVKGIAQGLHYLQSELPNVTVAHGHLKSANVLLDKNFNALLMDYGLLPVVNTEHVQQLLMSHKSPEYTQTGRVTQKSDVWCLGILILEILTGKVPANYVVSQGSGYDSVLAKWVNEQVSGENQDVFDPEMRSTEGSRGEMEKLLQIAASCCEEDLAKRWDLSQALGKIEAVKEKEY